MRCLRANAHFSPGSVQNISFTARRWSSHRSSIPSFRIPSNMVGAAPISANPLKLDVLSHKKCLLICVVATLSTFQYGLDYALVVSEAYGLQCHPALASVPESRSLGESSMVHADTNSGRLPLYARISGGVWLL
jgi:hypothetical protein